VPDLAVAIPLVGERYCRNDEGNRWLEGLVSGIVGLVLGEFGEDKVQAILPLGSLARGEASTCRVGGRFILLGDMEFFVVLKPPLDLGEARRACKELARRAPAALGVGAGEVEIDLAPTTVDQLARRSDRTMFACDLRTNRRCAWGDARVLDVLPPPEPGAIPKEDAARLVSNRIVEISLAASGADPLREAYWRAKVLLDLAGSLLAFRGRHESSYGRREDALARLAGEDASLSWAGGSTGLLGRLGWATRCKLEPFLDDLGEGASAVPSTAQVLAWARAVWEWEVREWLHGRPGDSTLELVARFKSRESANEKLRGWLKFALHPLRPHGSPGLRRFLRLLPQASPQTLCYAAIILWNAALQDARDDWKKRSLEWAPVELPAGGGETESFARLAATWEWLLK
jgi:hypothetical protein